MDARIAVIRQQQEAIETEMADLKGLVGYHQNRAKIRDLELIHASLDDDIADVRLMRGPWCPSRIPPEILCDIFHCYLLFFQNSAWTISQVCRAWRRIVLGCSTLWNTIHITSFPLKCSNAYRSRHPFGWDCHVTDLHAQRAIRRSREAPLSIQLDFDEMPQDPSVVLRALGVVAGQNLARWRSLILFDSSPGIGWPSLLSQALLPTQEMASLQRISFQYRHCHLLLPIFIAGVPSLSSLLVKLEDGGPLTMLMNQPWLERLKALTLVFCGDHHPQLGQLGPMMGKCKALEELNLQRRNYSLLAGESFDSSRWPPLPRGLQTVLLRTHTNFWTCVSGINITSLSLRMENLTLDIISVTPRSISLPSLNKLECFSYETTFTAGYLLDAPNTQSLDISHWTAEPTMASHPIRDKFPDKTWGIFPTKVSLKAHNGNGITLRDLFLRLSKTDTLSLCFYSLSVDALFALIPDLEGGSDTVVCPILTRVECEFMDTLPNSEASRIDGIIQAIQDRRGDVGLLRPSVDVYWKGVQN